MTWRHNAPSTLWQASTQFKSKGRPFKLVGELYYKDLDNLIPYEIENVRQRYYARNNSSGYATGLDVMVNGEFILAFKAGCGCRPCKPRKT